MERKLDYILPSFPFLPHILLFLCHDCIQDFSWRKRNRYRLQWRRFQRRRRRKLVNVGMPEMREKLQEKRTEPLLWRSTRSVEEYISFQNKEIQPFLMSLTTVLRKAIGEYEE